MLLFKTNTSHPSPQQQTIRKTHHLGNEWETLHVDYQPKDAKDYLENILVPQLKQDLSTKVASKKID
ncbi:MAG: hypothetical protein IPN94_11620 [Sphingobacteriales bacterium]|nr:hypothetical protein [Sphingobacteriales bacterium]